MNALFLSVDDYAAIYNTNNQTKVLPNSNIVQVLDSSFSTNGGIAFVIDFGPLGNSIPKGTLCKDGRYRAGKVYCTLSKPYREIGAVLTITLADSGNYYSGNGSDMYKIVGNKTITRTGDKSHQIVVNNIKITDGDGKTITWSCERVVTKIKDAGIGVLGDQFSISGKGNGVNRNGENYTVTITKDLVKNMTSGCASTFVDGIVEIENTDKDAKMTLDFNPYNDAACDRVAKVTIGKTEKIFYIP